jgi:hypothetical protein
VIDEALAVGDGHFQKKCIDKIRQFQEQKKTILFCSHALYFVSQICRRTLWLDHGAVMRYGPSVDVVYEYETFLLKRDRALPIVAAGQPEPERPPSPVLLREIVVCDAAGRPCDRFSPGDDVQVRLRVESDLPGQAIHALVGVHRAADDLQCFAVGTHGDGVAPTSGRTSYEFVLRLSEVPLLRGEYDIIAYVGDENAITVFDRRDLRAAFTMTGDRFEVGLITVKHRWQVEPEPAVSAPVRQ